MNIAIDFENVFIFHNNADNFDAQVFRLIAKADEQNIKRMRVGFPLHVALYQWWMNGQEEHPSFEMIHAKLVELMVVGA